MAKRCYGCMKMKMVTPVCELCGHDEREKNERHQLPQGTVVGGQYIVGKVLGQGGFGITYMGWDMVMHTPVAVKEYYPSGYVMRNCGQSLKVECNQGPYAQLFREGKVRFLREAETMAKLWNVPQIVRLYRHFEENNTAYIVMEYADGRDLRHYMRHLNRNMSFHEALAVLSPVMQGLSAAHKHGMVHRDISPDNIMILPDGQAKILDFGAVRWVEHPDVYRSLDASTQSILKRGFAPLEQYRSRGSLGPWTDVYALCATIHYCMTGRIPPDAMERSIGKEKLDWSKVPGLTHTQRSVLEKGMALDPKKRYASVDALQAALKPSGKAGWNKYILVGIAAAVLVGAAGLAAWNLNKKENAGGKVSTVSTSTSPETESTSPETESTSPEKEFTVPVTLPFKEAFDEAVPSVPDDWGVPETTSAENPRESQPPTNVTEPEETQPRVPGVDGWNVLASNPIKDNSNAAVENAYAFGTNAKRNQVISIVILNTLADAPADAVDASNMVNGSVKAWTVKNEKGYILYLAADGEMYAPKDCSYLFGGMTVLKEWKGFLNTKQVTDMGHMFWACTSLQYLDLSCFDTENVTSMRFMFKGCNSLKKVDVSTFDTSNVTDMCAMFNACYDLISVDVSNFDTKKVMDMSYMFAVCNSMTELNISNFNTDSVTDMSYMFCNSKKLTYIDMSNATTANVRTMYKMFYNCSNVHVQIGNFDVSKVPKSEFSTEFMPDNGMINDRYWRTWVY